MQRERELEKVKGIEYRRGSNQSPHISQTTNRQTKTERWRKKTKAFSTRSNIEVTMRWCQHTDYGQTMLNKSPSHVQVNIQKW